MATHSTVDKDEVNYFTSQMDWWDPKGLLHKMNALRIPFIRDGLIETGQVKQTLSKSEKPLENLAILDIGCGGGILSEALAKLGAKMVGLDAGVEIIQVAKNHAALDSTLTNLTYLNDQLEEHCKNQREKYDAVIASEVIEHVSDPDEFLKQSVACLKPGGSIFVTTLNKTLASYFIGIIFYEKILQIIPSGAHDHGKFISPDKVTELLEKYGCSVKTVRGTKYNMFNRIMEWSDSTSIFYSLHAVKKN